jgi:ribose 1,5-bisphosphate isomerase
MDAVEKTAEDIKNLKIQGARSIAIVGLEAIKGVVEENGFKQEFNSACNLLVSSRPTAVALYNAIEKIKKERSLEAIDKMIYYFENVGSLIAWNGFKLIKNNSTILTHCHSSSVVEIFKKAFEKKRKFKVIVTETRPLYQGEKTAKELSEAGIPVVYIDDSAPGHFIKQVDMLILGIDSIRKEGVVNKIGSYMLSILAKENKVSVYFVGETMKLDRRRNFVIEERNPEEVIEPGKLPNVKIENPAFDVTPWKYVAGVITEKGVLKPSQILRMLK